MRDVSIRVRDVDHLGSLIRATRKRHGLTLEDLALISNVGARAISEIERGKPTAQIVGVLRVLDALDLNIAIGDSDA